VSVHLLLVDDNPDDRALVRREIERVLAEVRIDEAGDAETFSSLLAGAETPWDVVVTDYELRWATGMDVFRRLRERWPDLPVILFTASGNEELAVQALKEGIDDYITKTPRHYGRVPYAVRACAERRRQTRAAEASLEALRRREAQLQLAMDAGAMAAWQLDLEGGRIILDGRSEGPFAGAGGPTAIADFQAGVHVEDRPAVQAALDAAAAGEARLQAVFRTALRGEERWLSARAVAGGPAMRNRWIGVVQDVTEAKRLEAQLRAADREKDEFIAMLAHELRNPLAPLGYVARLIGPGAPEEQLVRAQVMIERQVAVMARLLEDLLDVSQLTRHRVELQKSVLDLRDVIADAAEDAQVAVEQAGHRLTVSLPAEPVWVDGDRVRLQEILDNLVNNAVKFTPPPGTLVLTLTAEAGEAVLVVEDSGVGLESDMLERIFQPFVQARQSPTQPHRGLGIGLAVVRRLAQAHGGRVRARSAGAGRGSAFELRLPIAAAPAPAAAATATLPGPARQVLRVLVADDEVDMAESLRDLLELEGHAVSIAFDGATAIERAGPLQPEVMVLDVGMPNGSGDTVARWVRAQPWGASVKLIAVTGWGRDEDRRRTADAGFDLHLVKPVDVEQLLQALATAR
jgi:two-component system CheB/CheR fusion protein